MTTGIEWTDETWNPVLGCSHASSGCDNCYAERETGGRLSGHPLYVGLTSKPAAGEPPRFTGEIRTVPERLDQPIRWKRPRRVFVNSMSDLFHPNVPESFVVDVFAAMAAAPWHQFQVLTKRPARMAALTNKGAFMANVSTVLADTYGIDGNLGWPMPHVWLGTSIENDDRDVILRAKHLRATMAAVRWVSAEPLIGSLAALDMDGIDWVVAGGESGRRARPCHPDWLRDLRDRCALAGVPFLLKQWGEWVPVGQFDVPDDDTWSRPGQMVDGGDSAAVVRMIRAGKHVAGRTLDGVVHDQYPVDL